jgi:uncharacterized membrane protein
MSAASSSQHPPRSGIAGVVLGVGLGGFADGIALHQIAQWHNMGSAVLRPDTMEAMKQNMLWDGLFHAATWLITLAGVWLLWRDARHGAVRRARIFAGQMLMGWAAFNLVEGLIDHHLLNLHHVRDLPEHVPLYDWVFLGVGGVLLGVIGWMMSRPPPPKKHRSRTRGEAGAPER